MKKPIAKGIHPKRTPKGSQMRLSRRPIIQIGFGKFLVKEHQG